VTFFWPFSADYIVMELDHDHYQYAMVCSTSDKYLWILARDHHMEEHLLERLVQRAHEAGFDTSRLIFPLQQW